MNSNIFLMPKDPNRARQKHCRLCLSVKTDNLRLSLPSTDKCGSNASWERKLSNVCVSVFLSNSHPFLSRPLKQQDQILGSWCFTALRASLLSGPVIQSSHRSMTDGMRGMHSQLLHSLISHSTTERNRLTMKVRLIFHSYLLHKLMCPFMFSAFPVEPRQRRFHPDSAVESLTHPPSFFRLFLSCN